MPPLTLNQAAKEAGKSKQTLLDAIRGGRLTAPKDEQGRYQIDPAELFRVYPPTSQLPDTETETDPTRPEAETVFFERIIAGLESERDDLRRRLDQSEAAREREAAERREAQNRLTALLTYQPTPQADPPQTAPEPPQPPPPRPWPTPLTFWLAAAAAALSAGLVIWEVWKP